jgi:hypothetical protein
MAFMAPDCQPRFAGKSQHATLALPGDMKRNIRRAFA